MGRGGADGDRFFVLADVPADQCPKTLVAKGIVWHRFLDRIYAQAPASELNQEDVLTICRLRLELGSDCMDLAFRNSVLDEMVQEFLRAASLAAPAVLDLGCGDGAFGIRVLTVRPSAVLTFLDVDPAALDRVRTKLPGATTVLNVGHELPLPDGTFDVVGAAFVFHFHSTWALIEAAYRVLKPGGLLLCTYYGGSVGELVSYLRATGFEAWSASTSSRSTHYLVGARRGG